MKPGATTWPPASITRRASPWSPEPTATTRSPSTATSARRAVAPVPSMTEPFLMSSDQIIPALRFDDRHRRHSITLPDAVHVLHAGDGASKDGVVSVEMGRGAVADVELAPDLAPFLERDDGGLRHPLVLIWGRSSRTSRGRRP